jgi:hypothetical protein
MMSFEKRLARLEAARNIRLANPHTCVIFDGDIARVDAGCQRYERARRPDEALDDFGRRIMDEAGRFGGRVSSMTQAKYDKTYLGQASMSLKVID